MLLLLDIYGSQMESWIEDDGETAVGREILMLVNRIQKRVHRALDLAEQAGCLKGVVETLEAG